MPGVTYQTGISRPDGLRILSHYADIDTDLKDEIDKQKLEPVQLTEDARKGVAELNQLSISSHNLPIVACICGKSSVVCQITNVKFDDRCILSLRALYRAHLRTKPDSHDEADFDVDTGDSYVAGYKDNKATAFAVVTDVLRLLSNSSNFVTNYKKSDDNTIKQLILRLTPLASLLYIELSDPQTKDGLTKLKVICSHIKKAMDIDDYAKFGRLCDVLVALFPFSSSQKLAYLDELDGKKRFNMIQSLLGFGNQLFEQFLDMDHVVSSWKRICQKVGPDAARLLQAKLVVGYIQELRKLVKGSVKGTPGTLDRDPDLVPVDRFFDKLDSLVICDDGKRLLRGDYKRMKRMNKSSAEYQALRTYMDVVMDIPWPKVGEEDSTIIDIEEARKKLDSDHYGMQSAKQRILEYLSVVNLCRKRKAHKLDSIKAPILLLTGPPGVGKTSFSRSIASTLGQNFQRVSLGGLNDVAELKGHRRTYVGAIPGMIVQALRRSKSSHPLILLDEIDKISGETRNGNPEAALLEVLDPEQNGSFQDHYLGFPIDLSHVTFICTANDQWKLSDPLRDRMEVIELAGYSYLEKVEICKRYVIPRQMKRNFVPELTINDDTILKIATEYTREAGIRSLERHVGAICRNKAIEYDTNRQNYNPVVSIQDLPRYIGIGEDLSDSSVVGKSTSDIQELYGIANGLAYNSDGSGSLLKFEMVGLPGQKGLQCTGNLGDVLLESAQIAQTIVGYVLNKRLVECEGSEAALDRFNQTEVHLHVPEGAISKDGPSAGITMTLCLLSLMLRKNIPADIAMTGEITLTGRVLPIGGLQQKLLGAHLTGKISKAVVPRLNRRDVIEDYVRDTGKRAELNQLVTEEEELLASRESSDPYGKPEIYVEKKLGIRLIYVSDLADAVGAVWGDEVILRRRKELRRGKQLQREKQLQLCNPGM